MENELKIPATPDAKQDIPGRISVVLSALLPMVFGDDVNAGVGSGRPLGNDVPRPGNGAFFSFLDKFNPWLKWLGGTAKQPRLKT
jgi:hypothetical protein